MSRGRKGKKKKNLCKNGTVIRLFSMLEIAFCLQSYVVLKLGQPRVPTKHRNWVNQKKNIYFLALFGFAGLHRNSYGDDKKTFLNASR